MNEIAAPATLREVLRPRHTFNDIPDRVERFAAMQQAIDARMSRLSDPLVWGEFIQTWARFPHLSPENICLILDQQPHATWLNTHRSWGARERTPIQRGIAVIFASVRQLPQGVIPRWDGGRPITSEVRHRPGTLFDYTATAGAPLEPVWTEAQNEPREGFLDDLRAAAATIGYAVEARRDEAPEWRRVFALIHGQTERQKTVRLAHQLGAAAGGEAGAELFAYTLMTVNGMTVTAPQVPADPHAAVASARAGLRRILQRTTFRNYRG